MRVRAKNSAEKEPRFICLLITSLNSHLPSHPRSSWARTRVGTSARWRLMGSETSFSDSGGCSGKAAQLRGPSAPAAGLCPDLPRAHLELYCPPCCPGARQGRGALTRLPFIWGTRCPCLASQEGSDSSLRGQRWTEAQAQV